jgi:hypothetical protein
VIAAFSDAHRELDSCLRRARTMLLPPMKNFQSGTPLGSFLLTEPLVHGVAESITGEWINDFLRQYGEVMDKARRIHFKSLSGVLALQEEVARRWQERQAAPAEGQAATA